MRKGLGLDVALVAIAAAASVTPAAASLPDPAWRGAERLSIVCQVTQASSGPLVENSDVARTLCGRVKALAERGAPLPVEIVGLGHASLHSGNTVALLVNASVVDASPGARLIAFTIRSDRSGGLEPASNHFGSAPRVAPFASAADGAAWDEAISRSLSQVLPWLRPAETGELSPPRPIRERE